MKIMNSMDGQRRSSSSTDIRVAVPVARYGLASRTVRTGSSRTAIIPPDP
ncbi:hypothetical protein Aph01nite_05420 [Acrocarpospora phusangensis]|uniref:Uncharacterized protein n=1 Tax=Acrocarpospora phusangensis TaxID=1070424 RepID=A0A919ULI5_9ACTN|nr:hypothetical protein Aph01nite_05420 [Acrocarpospora phusangensis]